MWGNGKWFVLVAGGGGECAGVGERVREWTQAAITEIRGVRAVWCEPTALPPLPQNRVKDGALILVAGREMQVPPLRSG
jgi:hypothetical protein